MSIANRIRIRAGRFQHTAIQSVVNRISKIHHSNVRVNGLEIPFVHGGTGPAVLLLHGFADSKETWFLLQRLLSGRCTIIAPDMPGYGHAPKVEPESTTLRALGAFVAGFLDVLGRQKVHIVGNSMGGGVAVRVAHDFPERVETLTLLSPVGHVQEQSKAHQHWEEFGHNPLLPSSLEEYDAMLRLVLEKRLPLSRSLRSYLAERQASMRDDFEAYFDVLMDDNPEHGLPDVLDHVDHETLVLHGSEDRIVHPATGAYYEELMPNARFVALEGIGHAPQLEAPRIVARYIEKMVFEAR